MSLLSYRATPLPWCGISPAELLMGREIRSNIPQVKEKLTPQWPFLENFRYCNQEFKRKQKRDYDRRHRVRQLPDIPDDTTVWVTTDGRQSTGQVITPANAPRSYIVETPSGQLCRNRHHLNVVPPSNDTDEPKPTRP